MDNTIMEAPQIHLMFDGRSIDIDLNELDVGTGSTDAQIRQAVATHLNVPLAKMQPFAIDRQTNGNLQMRPEAVFGFKKI